MPAMVRRIKPGWAIGLPALGAVIAFIVLAGSCGGTDGGYHTFSGFGVTFEYPARARIAVLYEFTTCVEGVNSCPDNVLVRDESSGSSLWINAESGAETARRVRTENGADPADVNAMFDRIVETVRLDPDRDQ